MNNSSIEGLLKKLNSRNPNLQILAINKLQELNAQEAVKHIIEVGLSSENDRVRDKSIEALEQLGNNESQIVCFSLIKLLNDPEELIRSNTLDALAKLECISAIPVIQSLLHHESEWLVRVSAIEALVQLSEDDNLSIFKDFELALNDSNEIVRGYAAWGIGLFGRKELLPQLQKRLTLEKCLTTKIDILATKYRLGIKEDMKNLLKIIGESDENSVRKILNVLEELIEDQKLHSNLKQDIPMIIQSLTQISRLFSIEHNHAEQVIAKFESLKIQW